VVDWPGLIVGVAVGLFAFYWIIRLAVRHANMDATALTIRQAVRQGIVVEMERTIRQAVREGVLDATEHSDRPRQLSTTATIACI
jgi:hypothetical protein